MILGLLVTKYPNLCIVFLPAMALSANFQAKTILAYSNQLENVKRMHEKHNCNIKGEKNSSIVNSNEIIFSQEKVNDYNNIIKKNTNYKNKKLVRKKD